MRSALARIVPALDLDLDPISVGFDLRRHNMAVNPPEGNPLTVRYAFNVGGETKLKTITSTRTRVAATLRLHGYQVAGEPDEDTP